MFIISRQCKLCGSGSLGIRTRSGTDSQLLILCDECSTTWPHPDLAYDPTYPGIPGDSFLTSKASHWATEDEIRRGGWWDYVVGEVPSPEERTQLLMRLRRAHKHKRGTKPFFNLSVCET